MKLYTEEDLIKAIAFGFGVCHKEDRAPFNKEMIEFIKSLEPTKHIELPNDEEIQKESKFKSNHNNPQAVQFNPALNIVWEEGAKWMRDKIQGGNK
jgi:hypothetical protein